MHPAGGIEPGSGHVVPPPTPPKLCQGRGGGFPGLQAVPVDVQDNGLEAVEGQWGQRLVHDGADAGLDQGFFFARLKTGVPTQVPPLILLFKRFNFKL